MVRFLSENAHNVKRASELTNDLGPDEVIAGLERARNGQAMSSLDFVPGSVSADLTWLDIG